MNKSNIIVTTAGLVVPIGTYVPKGLAILFIIAALGVCVLDVVEKRSLRIFSRPQFIFLAALPSLGLLSALWASDQAASAHLAMILLMTFLSGGLLVKEAWRDSNFDKPSTKPAFVIGLTVGLVLLLIEMVSGAALYQSIRSLFDNNFKAPHSVLQLFNSGISVTTLMFWPLLLLLVKTNSKVLGLIFGGYIVVILYFSEAKAPMLAFICGLVAFSLCWFFQKRGVRFLVAFVMLSILISPWVPDKIPDPRDSDAEIVRYYSHSDFHRVAIWRATSEKIQEKILFGAGLDGARDLYGKDVTHPLYGNDQKTHYRAEHKGSGKKWHFYSEPIPLHPHNAALQIWVELGAIGAVLVVLLIWGLGRLIRTMNLDRVEIATILALAINLCVISYLSYGVWQSWWLSGQILAVMTLALILSPGRIPTK